MIEMCTNSTNPTLAKDCKFTQIGNANECISIYNRPNTKKISKFHSSPSNHVRIGYFLIKVGHHFGSIKPYRNNDYNRNVQLEIT